MLHTLVAVFFVLHGLVHLLYLGQSERIFELQSGMVWPADSWLFSRWLSDGVITRMASAACALAAAGFVAGGIGRILEQQWWRPVILGAAVLSALIVVAFWDGSSQRLDNQGGIGLLIDLAIIVLIFIV